MNNLSADMGLINKPLDVDFVVESKPLTKAEAKAISEFIRADKEKRLVKNQRMTNRKPEKTENVN